MKKYFLIKIRGFTLAEVLITLTVIGVIAALTIPSLMQNINDAQYHTAWRSSFSDLNQATNRLKMDNGGTLAGVFQNSIDMVNKYSAYLSYTKTCPSPDNCWHLANNWSYLSGSKRTDGNYLGIILGNGNLISLVSESQDCSAASHGLMTCGFIYEDVNGFKGPNIIGKDIYLTWITADGLSPAGSKDNNANTCDTGRSGYSCAAQYLMQ